MSQCPSHITLLQHSLGRTYNTWMLQVIATKHDYQTTRVATFVITWKTEPEFHKVLYSSKPTKTSQQQHHLFNSEIKQLHIGNSMVVIDIGLLIQHSTVPQQQRRKTVQSEVKMLRDTGKHLHCNTEARQRRQRSMKSNSIRLTEDVPSSFEFEQAGTWTEGRDWREERTAPRRRVGDAHRGEALISLVRNSDWDFQKAPALGLRPLQCAGTAGPATLQPWIALWCAGARNLQLIGANVSRTNRQSDASDAEFLSWEVGGLGSYLKLGLNR